VELIGKLVEERGYRGSGRTYIVADPDEGWVCAIVKGRHWVAQRVPDDKVMAIPNYYCIGEVDLSDTANFMGSPDIITYAVERGWYNPETDGKFLFKKAYSRPSTYSSKMNYIRHMSALNYLTGETYTTNPDTYPFAVTPNRKVGLRDMMEILRSHGENIDVKMDIEEGEQHPWCICRNSTVNSTIFQLRSYLPVEIGALMWTTGAAPCAEVYIPWYSGMTKSPAGFQRFATADEAIEKHMSDAKDKRVKYPDGVAWKFVDKWNWIHENYTERIKGVRKANNKFQEKLFKNQTKFEKSLKNKSGNELQDELNRYTADIYQEYFKLF
jgi:dipeptidase